MTLKINLIYLIFSVISSRAVNGARTRDPQLGKLMLYQLSYYRNQCLLYPRNVDKISEKIGKYKNLL